MLAYLTVVMMIIGVSVAMYRFRGGDDTEEVYDREIDTSDVAYDPREESVKDVVEANNEFSFALYHMLDSNENLFYSPWSISSAFSMVYEGARGETEDEIRDVFGFPRDYQELRKAYGYIHNMYNTNRDGYNLSTANSLWIEENSSVLEEYRWVLLNYYFANAENVDFSDPEKTSEEINSWVEEHTNGKITDLIEPEIIRPVTELILTNAIYFNGLWEEPFCENKTTDRIFYKYGGEEITVPFMKHGQGFFNYTRADGFQILQKNYVGNDTSMLFMMPDSGDLRDMEEQITYQNLQRWRDGLKRTLLGAVEIPKFTMETDYDLKEYLMELGMPSAFGGDANLSGIDGTESLFVSDAVHHAYVDVHEKGTEAAAATAVVGGYTSAPPAFVANRPFLIIIQDNATGNILFMGRVNEPLAGE